MRLIESDSIFLLACSQIDHLHRLEVLFGGRIEHESSRHELITSTLLGMVAPHHRLEASRILDRVLHARAHTILGVDIPRRPRSIGLQRPRVDPPRCEFLQDHYFPRELRGRAASIVRRDFDPDILGMPRTIPIDEEFQVWGRSYQVRRSSLGPEVGLGVFSLQTITVPLGTPPSDRPVLFPFCGPMYTAYDWGLLSRQCSSYGRYGIAMDLHPTFRFVDGYPQRTGNLAGYINSPSGFRARGRKANVEWVECTAGSSDEHAHRLRQENYILTCAIRTIQAGEELLASYSPRRTWHP